MNIEDQRRRLRGLGSSSEDEMKRFVLSLAKELNLDTGDALPEGVLMSRSLNLNPKQRDALFPAIKALVSEGIFEEKEGSVFLTEKGRDALY